MAFWLLNEGELTAQTIGAILASSSVLWARRAISARSSSPPGPVTGPLPLHLKEMSLDVSFR